MYNKFNNIGSVSILATQADSSLAVDFKNIRNARLGILAIYDSAPTDIATLALLPGTGPGDLTSPLGPLPSAPWKRFATSDVNTVSFPPLAAAVLISDVSDPLDTKYVSFTEITIQEVDVPRFMQLALANPDAAVDVLIHVYLDS